MNAECVVGFCAWKLERKMHPGDWRGYVRHDVRVRRPHATSRILGAAGRGEGGASTTGRARGGRGAPAGPPRRGRSDLFTPTYLIP